jgi:hypothetical protein
MSENASHVLQPFYFHIYSNTKLPLNLFSNNKKNNCEKTKKSSQD